MLSAVKFKGAVKLVLLIVNLTCVADVTVGVTIAGDFSFTVDFICGDNVTCVVDTTRVGVDLDVRFRKVPIRKDKCN